MPRPDLKAIQKRLYDAAAKYPEAHKDSPWGETVYKVNGKVFVFCGIPSKGTLTLSIKLPRSSGAALMLPFAQPTGYGLGKAGWISARFESGDDIPEGLLLEWLDESYRAVAPKKLVKLLDGATEPVAPAPKRRRVKRSSSRA